jgi:4-amino-4-deoxy-L-arabinose transferase-like glycosyltransferase
MDMTQVSPLLKRRSTQVLLVFLVLRLGLVLITISNPSGGLTLDSKSYTDLAAAIRFEGDYRHPEGIEDLRRPPVYPTFLALLYSGSGLNQPAATFIQILLVTVSSLLLLWMLDRMGYPSAGLVAAWLIAISPNTGLWSLTVMSEVVFTFFLVIALVLTSRYLLQPTPWVAFLTGVFLGLAALTRPIGVLLVAVWVLILLIAVARRWVPNHKLSAAGWLAVGSMLVVLPWMVRNTVVHSSFAISDIGGHTLESFNFAVVLSEAEGISRNEATNRLGELGGTWDQFRWLISEHPSAFVAGQVAGVGRVIWGTEITRWAQVAGVPEWGGFGIFRYLRTADIRSALENALEILNRPSEVGLLLVYLLSVVHTLALLILAIIGLIPSKEKDGRRRTMIVLCAVSALGLILISGAAGQARFRVPVEPFLAVLAGFGWWGLEIRRASGKISAGSTV